MADLNEVVAYNFRRARELRGLTQEETAATLERFLGHRLPQASISAIERAYEGERRREFDAHEILMFACAFDLPLAWFFIPPRDDHRRFRGTSDHVNELLALLLGRENQVDALEDRLRELGYRETTADDRRWAELTGAPVRGRIEDYRNQRKELLLALLDEHADQLDKAADDLGAFFDRLRATGIRGFVSEKLNDADYVLQPQNRTSRRERGRRPTT
jgi:transcriptional regulator with XRE-family HTH domain